MKRATLIVSLVLVSLLMGYAAAKTKQNQTGNSSTVDYRSQREIDETVKRLINERQLLTTLIGAQTDNYFLAVVQRTERGEAETHANFDDLFIVREGAAEMIVGGEIVSPKETAPGEWRGPSIKGGRSITLGVGDTLRIARGTPHQTVPRSPFTSLVVKVRTEK